MILTLFFRDIKSFEFLFVEPSLAVVNDLGDTLIRSGHETHPGLQGLVCVGVHGQTDTNVSLKL